MSEKIKEVIHKNNLIFNEILGVAYGTKPGLLYPLDDNNILELQVQFPQLYFVNGGLDANPVKNQNSLPNYAISRDRDTALGLIKAQVEDDHDTMGELLGYPRCCIKEHGQRPFNTWSKKTVIKSYENSQRCSYLLNNIFNFHSRLDDSQEHFEKLRVYGDLNARVPHMAFQLEFISHIPCSYDCEASLRVGRESERLMNEHFPDETAKIRATLKNMVLFYNMFDWVVLDGQVGEKQVDYRRVLWPMSCIGQSLMEILKAGDSFAVDGANIEILRGANNVGTYAHPQGDKPYIIDFE